MEVSIRPWQPGDGGYLCMPLARNFAQHEDVQARHPDWKLVQCPVCGTDCYEGEIVRQMKPVGVYGVCTMCAIKAGMNKGGKGDEC